MHPTPDALATFVQDLRAFVLVVAYTDCGRGADGISAFIVPREAPGLHITPQPHGMGLAGTGHGLLVFDGYHLGGDPLLGREGDGLRMVLRGFLDGLTGRVRAVSGPT